MMKKTVTFKWHLQSEQAFQQIKQKMVKTQAMAMPMEEIDFIWMQTPAMWNDQEYLVESRTGREMNVFVLFDL